MAAFSPPQKFPASSVTSRSFTRARRLIRRTTWARSSPRGGGRMATLRSAPRPSSIWTKSETLIPTGLNAKGEDNVRARATRLGHLLSRLEARVFEILNTPDDTGKVLVKLARGEYERRDGRGQRQGFLLNRVDRPGAAKEVGGARKVGENPKEPVNPPETKENISPYLASLPPTSSPEVGRLKPLDFTRESLLPPTSPTSNEALNAENAIREDDGSDGSLPTPSSNGSDHGARDGVVPESADGAVLEKSARPKSIA